MAEARKKTKLYLKSHPKFPTSAEVATVTSDELGGYVNTLFTGIFEDYVGCNVYCDMNTNPEFAAVPLNRNHPCQLDLFFKLIKNPLDNNKVVAFKTIADSIADQYPSTGKVNYSQIIMGQNEMYSSNKSAMITQDAVDIFSSLLWMDIIRTMPKDPSPADFNRGHIVVEASSVNGGTPYMTPQSQIIVYNVVQFIDIDSIMHAVFGSSKEEPKEYKVIPVKPIITVPDQIQIQPKSQKWLFNINRFDTKSIMDKCSELGKFNVGGGLNIIKGSAPA